MKSDISIPNSVFHAAEDLAKKMGVSLSELYTAALNAYIAQHQKEHITELPDQVYADEPSTLEPEWVKMKVVSLDDDQKKYPLRGKPVTYREPFKPVDLNASQKSPRVPGIDKGKIVVRPDFDDPLEEFEE